MSLLKNDMSGRKTQAFKSGVITAKSALLRERACVLTLRMYLSAHYVQDAVCSVDLHAQHMSGHTTHGLQTFYHFSHKCLN